MTRHNLRPTYAYGAVRIPGLRWLVGAGLKYSWFLLPAAWAVVLVVRVTRIPVLELGLLVTAVVATGGYGLALLSRPRVALSGDLAARWRRADQVAGDIRDLLPRQLPDARSALRDVAATRWEIALLMRDRNRVVGAYHNTESARWGFGPGDPQRTELDGRREALLARIAELDNLIDERIASLDRLLLALRSINDGVPRAARRHQRARLATEHADAVLQATARWRASADPGAGTAGDVDAYARAHRELSGGGSGGAGWLA